LTLDIGIDLPEEFVTKKAAYLGITGTGKSVGAGRTMEEMAKKNIPFICLDVLGVHRGIGESYSNVELINVHDYKDWEALFAHLSELISDPRQSMMINLLEWNDDMMQKAMAIFMNNLFETHRQLQTPRHLFVEEAEVFAPQQGYEESRESLPSLNRIMKRGRSVGLGCSLISQRPQDVNKKTLSQSQCTFLLHLEGVRELKVVDEMLKSSKDRKELRQRVEEFKLGECLIYSPQWLGDSIIFKFKNKETKHYGETPDLKKLDDYVKPPKKETKKEDKRKVTPQQLTIGIILGLSLYVVSTII